MTEWLGVGLQNLLQRFKSSYVLCVYSSMVRIPVCGTGDDSSILSIHLFNNKKFSMSNTYILKTDKTNLHITHDEEIKQETAKEAAKQLYPWSNGGSMFMPTLYELNQINNQNAFIEGAKWQENRGYTKKDLQEAFNAGSTYAVSIHKDFKQIHPNFNEWVKQYKK